MKQPRLEALGRSMRQYHRHQPWCFSEGGLHISHSYDDMRPDALSHWDEVGFVLNGRRFMVWWEHPRAIYRNAIKDLAFKTLGDGPDPDWLVDGATTLYKRVGKAGTRKKPVGHRSRESSDAQKVYYAQLAQTIVRLSDEGIDLTIHPSWRWKRMSWGMSVELVAPIEVRNEQELVELAQLARRLVQQQTTLAEAFPGAVYDRASWLGERAHMKRQADPTHPGTLIQTIQS